MPSISQILGLPTEQTGHNNKFEQGLDKYEGSQNVNVDGPEIRRCFKITSAMSLGF